MKKRLYLLSFISILCGSFLMLLTGMVILTSQNNKRQEKELISVLASTKLLFNGSNGEDTIKTFKAMDYEVIIIDQTGNNVYDDDGINYLQEEAILKLDDIVMKNDNQGNLYYYIASYDDGFYICIKTMNKISSTPNKQFLLAFLMTQVVLMMFVVIFIPRLNKSGLETLNQAVKKLNYIVDRQIIKDNEKIDVIAMQIEEVNKSINQKIFNLVEEKEKVDFVLNNMNRGLVVIDNLGDVIMINDYASALFKATHEVLYHNFNYLVKYPDLRESINATMVNKKSLFLELREEQQVFNINVFPLNNMWTLKGQGKNGVALLIEEITQRRMMEKMKREFFQNASHELKSPLTTIIGYQQMIREKILVSEEEITEATQRTIKEAERMNKILKEMLELSKLESNVEFTYDDVYLNDIIDELLEQKTGLIKERGLVVIKDVKPVVIKMNQSHAYQLISNLLENAIKYNVNNGSVEIKLTSKELIVKDTGIGIPKDAQERIFERFYRVDKGRSKAVGGTGLGLAIVKHICSLYKFHISLDSKVNEGSTFTICFYNKKI